MSTSRTQDPTDAIETATGEIGRQLWNQLSHRAPSIFERRWWDDRILSWAMADESVKVQMFRFVDVLPMLKSHQSLTRHLQEYFEEVDEHLPGAARLVLDYSQPNTVLGRALAYNARSHARRMAQRFIAGTHVEEVLQSIAKIRKQGFAFTLDLLGEAVISEREADVYQQAYLDLMRSLAPQVNAWPESVQIDCDQHGPIPRLNVSLKLSSLFSQFNPIDPAGTSQAVKERLRPLLRVAKEQGAYVHVDMEQYSYKDLTLRIFKEVLTEDEFRDVADVGIVIQAYLPDAHDDLVDLRRWAEQRGTPIWIRLVKGAYWDYETVVAAARNWPVPVYRQKWQSDENFERQTLYLMENQNWLRPAIASHNLRSIAHAIACAQILNIPASAFEIQMLYGMTGDVAQIFAEMGYRVRIYTPFGELLPGMAYLVRRLLENTSNDSFLRHSFSPNVSVEELFMNPAKIGAKSPPPAEPAPRAFVNEPHLDFSKAEHRDAMQAALHDVRSQFGREYPLIINGRAVETKGSILSRNPSQKSEVLGKVSSATSEDAFEAIQAARNAFREWSCVEPKYRAEYLKLIAAEMRARRYELAAWEVFECGKPWAESDADVAEAIDFCMYYAHRYEEMAGGRHVDVPGEENEYFYRPRGVAVIIAPWNFPLAILTGMTTAALVTGNTLIMKPAEQSPIIAAKLMEMIEAAGVPEGVVSFLPGVGEDVGPALVGSPDVDLIAFTGSRTVGLHINHEASNTDQRQTSVKKVIAEMGGKNAIIIDDDADLDEAVAAVVYSAFGYAGQKCSACSRAVVLESVYDAFLERLTHAASSLKLGPSELPGTNVGPVIDEDAFRRVQEYIELARSEHFVALETPAGKLEEQGYFIGPHIFAEVDPQARIAQEEIFGPVLAVIKARNLDEAFEIANGTDYALTGGIFSRSPAHLQRARREFEVGNLYLNRGITGALVERQPFGGFRLSGIGTKAGGPDYLQQFVIPVNVTENTLRRGFAPAAESEGE